MPNLFIGTILKFKIWKAVQIDHHHKQIERVARYKSVISADKSFPDGSTGSVTGDAASRASGPQESWEPHDSTRQKTGTFSREC
jgi:hypothetical protein